MSELQQAPATGKKIRSRKISTRIDMTPMVDLAFLLLTFFILTSQLKKQRAMEITMPDEAKNPSEIIEMNANRVLTVLLDGKDKVIWYTGTQPVATLTNFSANGIRQILQQKNAAIHGMFVIIKATDQARYKNLVDIIDELSITHIEHYAISEVTEDDRNLINGI